MAHGHRAAKAFDDINLVEVVADKAQATFGMELFAVEGNDTSRFLAAMLEGMQAEGCQGRRIIMAEDAEYTAFLAQAIIAVS